MLHDRRYLDSPYDPEYEMDDLQDDAPLVPPGEMHLPDVLGMTIGGHVAYFHGVARGKGWWPALDTPEDGRLPCNVPEKLFLVAGELTEAGEEYRRGRALDEIYFVGTSGKPEGFAVELADAYIRLCDLIGGLGIGPAFEQALAMKAAYNLTRSHRHGGKLA